jgi:hypothetical protein
MRNIFIVFTVAALILSGCGDDSSSKVSKANSVDAEPPSTPKMSIGLPKYASTSIKVPLEGEPNSAIYVNGVYANVDLDEDGKAVLNIPIRGRDGIKEIKIELEDIYGNRSEPLVISVVKDTTPPTIEMLGNSVESVYLGSIYRDAGAKAIDNIDKDISNKIVVNSNVDTSRLGEYKVIYSVKDSAGNEAKKIRVVKVTKKPISNHAPTAVNSNIETNEDSAKAITLSASDIDGDSLTYIVTSQPANGVLSGSAPNLTYTPNANFNGSDSFKFKVSDGSLESEVAVVTIDVKSVNDAPTYIGSLQDITTQDSQELDIDLNGSFSDIEDSSLTYSVTGLPSGVSFDSSSKKISGKLNNLASNNSPYNVEIKATDSQGLSATKSIKIDVYKIQTHNWAADKKSEYLKDVEIPTYDANNPEHFLIETSSDWSHINDSDKRVFFVLPSVEPQSVVINSSGTAQKPRILTLYSNSNAHPALLSSNERAKLKSLTLSGASNWIVDRISIPNHINESAVVVGSGCSDIVFNKIYINNFVQAFLILSNKNGSTHDITIQNSKLDSMTLGAIDDDRVAILIAGDPWDEPTVAKNIHILNNEIINANDGIMPIRHPNVNNGHPVNYAGLIIDYNRIYVDKNVYTDGNGNITKEQNAKYALTENAIDIKGGSDDPNNPVIISNNMLWGYRQTDQNGGGSGSWGGAIVIHYNSKNIVIKKNLIFDSNRGIAIADNGGLENASENVVIEDNILYDIGKSSNNNYIMFAYDSKNITIQRNTIVSKVGGLRGYWNSLSSDTSNQKVACNVVVDEKDLTGSRASDLAVENNYYYATTLGNSSDGLYYPNRSDAKLEDVVLRATMYSNNLEFVTLPNILTTENSPHSKWCEIEDISKEQSISEGRGAVIEPISSSGDKVEIVQQPSHGELFVDFNGTVVYIPESNYTGSDSYAYKACDIENSADCSKVSVNVDANNASSSEREAKTNWGFKPFSVPNNTIRLSPQDSLVDAINSLKNQGGGKLILEEGVYRAQNIKLPRNIEIVGAGIGKTVLKATGGYQFMEARGADASDRDESDASKNIIIKNLSVDCREIKDYGCLTFNYGVRNVLVDNVEVYGAARNNISIYNEHWNFDNAQITIQNVISHHTRKYHGISVRFAKGVKVSNNIIYKCQGLGIDVSRGVYAEVNNNSIIDTGYGMKFPGSDYIYIHDNFVDEVNIEGGIKFNPISKDYNNEHVHLENNIVKHSRGGIVDWGDDAPAPHFAEFVSRNNIVVDDYNDMNIIRVANGVALYNYGDKVKNRNANSFGNEFKFIIERNKELDPYETDGVGYKSWDSNFTNLSLNNYTKSNFSGFSGYGKFSKTNSPKPGIFAPFVPNIMEMLNLYSWVYVSPNGTGDGSSEDSPTTLQKLFEDNEDSSLENRVIIALDGEYFIKEPIKIYHLKNTLLISKNKYGAKLVWDLEEGATDEGLFTFVSNRNEGANYVKNFAIVGFESYPKDQNFYPIYKEEEIGKRVKDNGELVTAQDVADSKKHFRLFIFHGGGAYKDNGQVISDKAVAKDIYIADTKFHHYSMVLYSGATGHNWTLDRVDYSNSNGSYLWYMKGWHLSVINSVAYDGDDLTLSLRGYGALGNVDKLESSDWSTLIANNTFGSNSRYNRARATKYHLNIFTYDESSTYMPQNVAIVNNVFVDSGEYSKKPLQIWLSGKRDNGVNQKMDGLFVVNNYTDQDSFYTIEVGDNLGKYSFKDNKTSISLDSFGFASDTNRDYSISLESILNSKATDIFFAPRLDILGNLREGIFDVGAYEAK